jgi:hypothetical protein
VAHLGNPDDEGHAAVGQESDIAAAEVEELLAAQETIAGDITHGDVLPVNAAGRVAERTELKKTLPGHGLLALGGRTIKRVEATTGAFQEPRLALVEPPIPVTHAIVLEGAKSTPQTPRSPLLVAAVADTEKAEVVAGGRPSLSSRDGGGAKGLVVADP